MPAHYRLLRANDPQSLEQLLELAAQRGETIVPGSFFVLHLPHPIGSTREYYVILERAT